MDGRESWACNTERAGDARAQIMSDFCHLFATQDPISEKAHIWRHRQEQKWQQLDSWSDFELHLSVTLFLFFFLFLEIVPFDIYINLRT